MPPAPPPRHPADDPGAVALVFCAELDDVVRVSGDDGHHLRRVRRLRDGESVTLADGEGRWRPAVVAGSTRDALELRAAGEVRTEPVLVPRLTLAFALTKGDHPELVVQKATELGVDRIVPVLAGRSVARRTGASGVERLRRVAREAAAQSRRARIPVVDDVVPFDAAASWPGLVVADREGDDPESIPPPPDGEWVVLVGPEGGFEDDERAALAAVPRLAVGPHVLRAETAAIAAVAALTTRRHPA